MAMDICRLCSEERDDEDLIEVKDSLIRLKSGIVDFESVIREILGIKNVSFKIKLILFHIHYSIFQLDHLTFICFSCKEQIFSFYNFKLKVKPNLIYEHQLQN